jgi:hypothetical protein
MTELCRVEDADRSVSRVLVISRHMKGFQFACAEQAKGGCIEVAVTKENMVRIGRAVFKLKLPPQTPSETHTALQEYRKALDTGHDEFDAMTCAIASARRFWSHNAKATASLK